MPASEPVLVALKIAEALELAGVPYVIGGSIASTVFGEPRMTADVDVAVRLDPAKVDHLLSIVEADFFVHRESTIEASHKTGLFNLVHKSPLIKVDLYARPDDGIYAQEILRARRVRLQQNPDRFANIASPEDTVLQKLSWFRAAGEVSERQWRDVLGLIKANREQLEWGYLDTWSKDLGVDDLLDRARTESDASSDRE